MSVINNHQIIQLFFPFVVKKKRKKSLFSIDSVEVNNDLVVFAVSCFVSGVKTTKKWLQLRSGSAAWLWLPVLSAGGRAPGKEA